MNLHPILSVVLYLLLGFILDYIITLYYQFIVQRKAAMASLFGVMVTALNLYVIAEVVVSKQVELIGAFLIGQGIGTFLAIKLRRSHE